jgi:hypothetical protein
VSTSEHLAREPAGSAAPPHVQCNVNAATEAKASDHPLHQRHAEIEQISVHSDSAQHRRFCAARTYIREKEHFTTFVIGNPANITLCLRDNEKRKRNARFSLHHDLRDPRPPCRRCYRNRTAALLHQPSTPHAAQADGSQRVGFTRQGVILSIERCGSPVSAKSFRGFDAHASEPYLLPLTSARGV